MQKTKTIKNPTISSIFDYMVEVTGEFNYSQKQMFKIKSKPHIKLLLINAQINKAMLLSNDQEHELTIGDELELVDSNFNVTTDSVYFGKIIDVAGNIIAPEALPCPSFYATQHSSQVFKLAHDLMSVKTLNEQLYTGINAIDLLIPIGKGQRELIIGDRQTGKTHIALNTIINQANKNVKCIYVAIGQKRENIAAIYSTLEQYNALKNTIIIDAFATSTYDQFLAPYIGMAHAENLSLTDDVLIVFDDLTKHANVFREMALLSDAPVGKEAMPGDMFFAHSQLLERSGNFIGRKTITALPILQTIDGDITSLISSNIISITDGQIVTSADMFAAGKLPAINIDLSVSRTGSSVQNHTITKVAGAIGKIYRQYKRHLKLATLDYEFNAETSLLLSKGKMIEKMFTQKGFSLYSDRFILLTSKIISWGLFKGVKNEQTAMNFLNKLIDTNKEARETFLLISKGTNYDDNTTKNYFAYALKQYSDYLNLGWNIKTEYKFIAFDKQFLENIAKELGDK
ncbi:ATP F0F1 synthase subunit alpha [Mycoplasma sp. ES3157-GEN-MYC]|uniref:ATP F0F1 synthase subunit alpha n=1 Tax=Mycoplasma miroungigenitalium TaxID=754515 RepID=A0A6M4JC53_9MOLU|nr:ATP F0F1 synthase subunit alpha [Mycoplasma miroungigenitalium]MBU4690539.1 ATP F0F1 synthase subunit alpha [Mycoplasma miroungigenitalium]MBU4691806.1 ATP F0F1 synthase subunit alpha [Mycoplasma miroungigenitalium]QJR43667.1 ATP F0F1 synthase subunit alpha [Mycoplasma miroungigenitalium]